MSQSLQEGQDGSQVTNIVNVSTLSASLDSIKHGANADDQEGDPHISGVQASIYADYVIVFDCGRREERESNADRIKSNYRDLLARLQRCGLKAESRMGNDNVLLLFILCPWERLQEAVHASRLTDWLHGVGSIKTSDPSHIDEAPLSEAERLRVVYTLITAASDRTAGALLTGAGIIPQHPDFPQVLSITPIHNPVFNRTWLNKLSTKYLLDTDDSESSHDTCFIKFDGKVNEIRDHFGEQLALYFSFLQFYFLSLSLPAALGICAYAFDLPYSIWYGIFSCLWAGTVVELWKQRESSLTTYWGCRGSRRVEQKRAAFKGLLRTDPVSGKPEMYSPWWKREVYRIAALPVMAAFALALAAIITCIFSIEVFITEAYQGAGKQYLGILPTILFTLAVPNFVKLYQRCALFLTNLENHETESSQDQHLTGKVFVLNFFTAYLGLFLTAYIYIPLGKVIVPHLSLLDFSGATKASALQFAVNPSRLQKQLFSLMVINQGINFGTEVLLPFAMRFGAKKVQDIQNLNTVRRKKPRATAKPTDREGEHDFLERIRREVALPEESLFVEFAEMVTQFGHVSLFGVIWPLAPLAAFVNNWFELRGDAAKVALNTRRPNPVRVDSIGPWIDAMRFISWLSAITTSSLIYLFRPGFRHVSVPPLSSWISGGRMFKAPSLLADIESNIDPVVCLKTLLVIVISEHFQELIGNIISHAIKKLYQEDEAHIRLRRSEWTMREGLIRKHRQASRQGKDMDLQQQKVPWAIDVTHPHEVERNPFWSNDTDMGDELDNILSKKDV